MNEHNGPVTVGDPLVAVEVDLSEIVREFQAATVASLAAKETLDRESERADKLRQQIAARLGITEQARVPKRGRSANQSRRAEAVVGILKNVSIPLHYTEVARRAGIKPEYANCILSVSTKEGKTVRKSEGVYAAA